MSPRLTREFILSEIRRLAALDPAGRIGRGRFMKATGIKSYDLSRHWATWTEAVEEAGITPNTLTQPLDRDELLGRLAAVTHALGRVPTYNHLRVEWNKQSGFPAPQTFQVRFGSKASMVDALREWVAVHPEFADIAPILASTPTDDAPAVGPGDDENSDGSPAVFSESYVPPIVSCLPSLARMESELPIEFERRVAIAFEVLGLEIQRLGQGSGREPDGIAKCRQFQWAVIYDAKARAGVYRIQTEDRKFREYIQRYAHDLRVEGMTRIYFAVVSSAFSESDLSRARELVLGTDVKSVVLVEAGALVSLVEQRVRSPLTFGPPQFERAFAETRIVR